MIRVGFRPIGNAAWLGGRVYLDNLLYAVSVLADRRIDPIIVCNSESEASQFAARADTNVFRATGPLSSRQAFVVGRVLQRAIQRDLVLELWMRRAGVDLFSHAPPLGRRYRGPWLAWIPDLQHRRCPEFFSASERRARDALFREWARDSTLLILSSRAAQADLVEFLGPTVEAKCRVLNFVSQPKAAESGLASIDELVTRYAVPRRFFHLPNQFWKHKNHTVVVEALALLRASDPEIVVVATGGQEDFRHPHHFAELMDRVRALGLAERFRPLGVVPFADLMTLMKHSVAVINPSLFEGWSTTVEEAKSAGKALLLSDLAVHREQAPARADYFAPHDAAALAELLRRRWRDCDPRQEERAAAHAEAELAARTRAFGERYQQIVLEALEAHGRSGARQERIDRAPRGGVHV